jgi:hypothetical protein
MELRGGDMKLLVSFIVDVPDEEYLDDFDVIRDLIGDGTAELYDVKDAAWAEEVT